jgi:D-glycero-alpha-D-manno-heptose-7-phosphate kinase
MSSIFYRAKAPLRLGFAGGGTDIPEYSENFGGAILNATISLFAYATIEPLEERKIVLNSVDKNISVVFPMAEYLEPDGNLDLLKGTYNRIVRDYSRRPLSFRLSTYVDAPPGSGLGSSSTLVVAIVGAFAEWLKLPLGEYDIAHLAYDIERVDLRQAGGRQDHFAATFGGFNFMEFSNSSKVLVNPLRIKHEYTSELELNIVLFYTSVSRYSSAIIEAQSQNIKRSKPDGLNAMHHLKEQAFRLKEALLTGNLENIGPILDYGWQQKKLTASDVTNPEMDGIYRRAVAAGSTGGKISGAGGGGFFMFYCPGNSRYSVIEALKEFKGEFRRYNFTEHGLMSWAVKGNENAKH